MSQTHAYRIEISGGFSGSAYRYESLLTGSLDEVERFIASMTDDAESASMMVTEGFSGVIDVLQDGKRVFRTSFLPALRFSASGLRFAFEGDTWTMDGEQLDDDVLQDRLDEIIDAFVDGFTRELSLGTLGFPAVDGSPLADGASLDVTNVAGRTYAHVCGQVVGDFGEGHQYA